MKTEEQTMATASLGSDPSDDRQSAVEALKRVEARLSPERLELLKRTLKVRRLIGKVSTDVVESVPEMR